MDINITIGMDSHVPAPAQRIHYDHCSEFFREGYAAIIYIRHQRYFL